MTTQRQAFWRQVRRRPGVLFWYVVETVREWYKRARTDIWDSLPAVARTLEEHMPTHYQGRDLLRCRCGLEFRFIDAKAWHRHAAAMVLNELTKSGERQTKGDA